MNYTQDQREYMKRSLLYEKPVDPANWVGLVKFQSLLPNLRVRKQIIYRCMKYYYRHIQLRRTERANKGKTSAD